jgi:hypothetical protein
MILTIISVDFIIVNVVVFITISCTTLAQDQSEDKLFG